jgi:hypothetical protein
MTNTEPTLIFALSIIVAACCIPIGIGIVAKHVLKRRHPDSKYLKKTSLKVIPEVVYILIVGASTMYIIETKPPEVLLSALESDFCFLVKMGVLIAALYLAAALLVVLRLVLFGKTNENDV